MTDYKLLCESIKAITEGVPHEVANLANTSALLWEYIPDINWVGFYKMENGKLVLGPFQGKAACIEIEVGKGVCGSAVKTDKPLVVFDVHKFPGHIACDSASNAEVVFPLHKDGKIWGVLDIDSTSVGRFRPIEVTELEKVAKVIEEFL